MTNPNDKNPTPKGDELSHPNEIIPEHNQLISKFRSSMRGIILDLTAPDGESDIERGIRSAQMDQEVALARQELKQEHLASAVKYSNIVEKRYLREVPILIKQIRGQIASNKTLFQSYGDNYENKQSKAHICLNKDLKQYVSIHFLNYEEGPLLTCGLEGPDCGQGNFSGILKMYQGNYHGPTTIDNQVKWLDAVLADIKDTGLPKFTYADEHVRMNIATREINTGQMPNNLTKALKRDISGWIKNLERDSTDTFPSYTCDETIRINYKSTPFYGGSYNLIKNVLGKKCHYRLIANPVDNNWGPTIKYKEAWALKLSDIPDKPVVVSIVISPEDLVRSDKQEIITSIPLPFRDTQALIIWLKELLTLGKLEQLI